MKKVFLMLAAVAALTACSASSNDDGNANANDSTAVEEQTANVDAEKIGVEGFYFGGTMTALLVMKSSSG